MKAATDESPGRIVRSARESAGLTREDLARDAQVSTSTVARLELRDRLPNVLALTRITARLDLTVGDLVPADTPAQAAS